MQRRFYPQGTKYHQMRFWKLDGRNTHLPTGLLPLSRIYRGRKSIAGGKHGTLRLQAVRQESQKQVSLQDYYLRE